MSHLGAQNRRDHPQVGDHSFEYLLSVSFMPSRMLETGGPDRPSPCAVKLIVKETGS